MNDLRFTLTTDGPADSVLVYHLSWVLRKQLGSRVALQPRWADLRSLRHRPANLAERIDVAVALYPCDLLFVHRDAEGSEPVLRYKEIGEAVTMAKVQVPFIPVVPIRMTEAWLLFDESAVRWAAGNPNGHASLGLPAKFPERIPDPKAVLHEALRAASGLRGRRLRDFNASQAAYRVAERIDDFSPLRDLSAFLELEKRVVGILRTWA